MSEPTPSPPKRPPLNWADIEPHYRAGIRSLKEIGEEFGVSAPAIVKHAQRHDWQRDLGAKIRAKADAKVNESLVNAEKVVNRSREATVVEVAATAMYQVRIGHRKRIQRTQSICDVLMGEIEVMSNPEGQGLIESLMDACRTPDEPETEDQAKRRKQRQRDLLDKVIGLDGRVDTFKRLVESQDRLIQLERQAFSITDKTPADEDDGIRRLSDLDRASRTAALLALAMERRGAAMVNQAPVSDAS